VTSDLDLDIAIQLQRLRLGSQQAPPDIDMSTGAPVSVRRRVGAANNARDRLSTLQKTYPDAKPYGDDNFVYTDPRTGRQTLYNEQGMMPSLGDIASVGPEIAEFAGGAVGGAAALATGAGAVATPVSVGLGAAAGKEIYDRVANAIWGTDDTRSLGEHATDTAVTTGVNTVGGPAGELAFRGLRRFVGPAADPLVNRAFENLGINKMAGATSGSSFVQSAEQGAYNSPGGTTTMQGAFKKTLETTTKAARDIAGDIANTTPLRGGGQKPVLGQERAGGVLKRAAAGAGERFRVTRQQIDDLVTNTIGATTPTQLTAVQTLLHDLETQAARAPESMTDVRRAIAEARAMMTDAQANGGTLPFDILRRIRTRIGQQLEQPDASGWLPGEDRHMKDLYHAIRDDIYGAARAADGAAGRVNTDPASAEYQLGFHDRYVRLFRNDAAGRIPPATTLTKVLQSASDAKALQYALEGSKEGTQRLWQLRRSVTPEEWDVISASIFDSLGRAKPNVQTGSLLGEVSDDFSIATFLTNWEALGKGTAGIGRTSRDVLFGGTRYGHVQGAINDLVRVTGALKKAERLANTSGTARSAAWHGLFGALGGTIAGVMGAGVSGGLMVGAGQAVGTMAAGFGAAKLLTSPRFVRWLTTSARVIGTNPNAYPAMIGRLTAIAKAEPDLADAIAQYRSQLETPQAPPEDMGQPPTTIPDHKPQVQ
jgi:hypothetical protein